MRNLSAGLYEQIINSHLEEKFQKLGIKSEHITKENLKNFDSAVLLTQYLNPVLKKSLEFLEDSQDTTVHEQIACCNEIIKLLAAITEEECLNHCKINDEGEVLLAIGELNENSRHSPTIQRPLTSLTQSSLFTGSSMEPSLIQEFKAEIGSADKIDILVSFIKWSGIRLLMDELSMFCMRGNLRVITTSYMGATDIRAIEFLAALPNTEVRISYDTERTRLHAKAYYFQRETGFSTAYIGSSNLSNPAITSGLEWNVKLTERDSHPLIDKIQASFETYWNDPEFMKFEEKDRELFLNAIHKEWKGFTDDGTQVFFDITPFYYQKEILERLQAERTIHNHYKNLIVAATGTGKTVISAFDFRRYRNTVNSHARLLFVAHREEILKQSLATFRTILKDHNFGDLCIHGVIPAQLDHLFISIQSFNSTGFSSRTSPNDYDVIIVDEFHHAAAESYQKLLSYYQPKILIGLTATPERMDNLDILKYFDGRIAAEIRLSEAIGRNLLAPFHYFGVTDTADLDDLEWSRGKYNQAALSKLYTGNSQRADHIRKSLLQYVTDIHNVIGLGFCVSIDHAKYMADAFTRFGIPSTHLSSESTSEERNSVQGKLRTKDIHFIFVVDLYNEGVDIPEVNTILFLRPTESLTVFIQQLGRGLRLADGKECLTVLDFVGRQHANYQFDAKYRALVTDTTIPLAQQIEKNTFSLPRGCFIGLEKVAQETILSHIERSLSKRKGLIQKISRFTHESGKPLTVEGFLSYYHLSPQDIYGKSSFRKLCAEAKQCETPSSEDDERIFTAAKRLQHIDSVSMIRFIRQFLSTGDLTQKKDPKFNVLWYSLFPKSSPSMNYHDVASGVGEFRENSWGVKEINGLLSYLENKTEVLEREIEVGYTTGLSLHCTYSRDQIFAGLGHWTPEKSHEAGKREGVLFLKDKNLDIFLITLNKSEKHFSPSTMYKDYAINEMLFHWQSQSTTSASSPTGQRYINHEELGSKVLLFVREFDKINNVSQPYVCLGTASYVSHSGSKPMSIVWRLHNPIPAGLMKKANKTISG
jgi:superfamily II DNA or RNA helicase